jgi:hypothetical protein
MRLLVFRLPGQGGSEEISGLVKFAHFVIHPAVSEFVTSKQGINTLQG